MPIRLTSIIVIILLITDISVFTRDALSCPIPVYRYALEFWEPDPYRITVYTHGGLSDTEQHAYHLLAGEGTHRFENPNIKTSLTDLEEDPQALNRRHPNAGTTAEYPRIIVQYPLISGKDRIMWDGPLTIDNVEQLLDSPARSKTAEYLSRGDMVWIFLESGNRSNDRESMSVLERELNRLRQTLELPDPELWWSEREGATRPEISFQTITLSRDDPAEQQFIHMLLHSEEDLGDFDKEPIVFPVFGRGIALWAIVGRGINTWNITDAAEFLTGSCSCQVKMMNPGMDLLISKDWEESVEKIADVMLTPLTGFPEFQSRGEEAERRLGESNRITGETGTGDVSGVTGIPSNGRAPSGTRPAEHQYVDIFDEFSPDSLTSAQVRSGSGDNTNFYTMIIMILAGVFFLVVLTGLILFKFFGDGKRSGI